MGPRAGLDDLEKRKFWTLPELELQHLGHPARSQSMPTVLWLVEIIIKLMHENEENVTESSMYT
jgi:hypothetical protein